MDWIVGDIHGMIRPLETLLTAIGRRDAEARFVFVGDYVNRGPSPRAVVDLLLGLGEAAVCCRGNHDDVMHLMLGGRMWSAVGAGDRVDRPGTCRVFLNSGLDATLLDYGATADELTRLRERPTAGDLDRVAERVPAAHRRFFADLRPCHVTPAFFVAHAHWPINAPGPAGGDVPAGLRRQAVWTRFTADEIDAAKAWDRPGYFGHTPVLTYYRGVPGARNVPIHGRRLTLLDTAAFGPDGRLSAVCHQSGDLLQAHRTGDLMGILQL